MKKRAERLKSKKKKEAMKKKLQDEQDPASKDSKHLAIIGEEDEDNSINKEAKYNSLEIDQEFENAKFNKFDDLEKALEIKNDDNLKQLDEAQGANEEIEAREGRLIRKTTKDDDLKVYKKFLKTKAGAAFVTNVLRVALNKKEERLAG